MGEETAIYKINVNDIVPNRFNPRLVFDQQSLIELAKSIEQHGIIQPLVLRKLGDKYEIIAGERRLKAAKIVGLEKVPAVVMDLDDKNSAEVAILENTQRANLTPIEEARSYKKLLDKGYLIQEQLASRMGKSQSTVSNKLRLLNLSDSVQEALLNNAISERHARSLLQVSDQKQQENILNEIVSKRLNVRDTEKYIKDLKEIPTQTQINTEIDLEKTQVLEPITDAVVQNESISTFEPISDIPIQPINTVIKEESGIPDLSSVESIAPPNISGLSPENQFIINEPKPVEQQETAPKPFLFDVGEEEFIEDEDEKLANQINAKMPVDLQGNNKSKEIAEKIKNVINELKSQGHDIKIEEFNFDAIYQINIKIAKN